MIKKLILRLYNLISTYCNNKEDLEGFIGEEKTLEEFIEEIDKYLKEKEV